MKSKKKLAWQSGNYCAFAEIELSLSDGNGLLTLLQPDGIEVVPERWRAGVHFGLDLLAGKLARLPKVKKTRVTITSFRGQPGDTTSLVVAYVTFLRYLSRNLSLIHI